MLTEKIAKLAKIHLTSEEKVELSESFKKILVMFEKMDECNTENVQLSDSIVMGEDNLRNDLEKCTSITDYLADQSDYFIDGYFQVPTVIENEKK